MHQHPRASPRSASAASNPTTNPERTNNSRDQPPQRTRSSVDLASYTERANADTSEGSRRANAVAVEDRDATKLNQIIQHFHCKAALMICHSRATLPQVHTRSGEIKQNRWFNIVLDETDVISDDLEPWKRPDLAVKRPPPLVIEVYLDTSHLSQGQALVIFDEAGKRHDVSERLQSSADSSPRPSRNGARSCEVVIERWTIELGDDEDCSTAELNETLPNVYKKGVCLFRSLYSFARFLPAWKLQRRLTRQPGKHQALRLNFRIKQDHRLPPGRQDSLYAPLYSSQSASDAITEAYEIPALPCRAGALSIGVHYRTNCDFEVADSESILSSRFLGLDEGLPIHAAGRSLPAARGEQARIQHSSLARATGDSRARLGAYGSLGTFHAADKRGSPVTELKQRVLDDSDDDDRQTSSKPRQTLSREPSQSLKNNPPFKSGSLASSPRPSPSPSTSAGRDSSFAKYAGTSSGKRVSLNTLPQQALRAPPAQSETAVASSGSSSPKPAPVHRYSSSFANRNRRYTPGNSKTGESGGSSGRASSSSNKDSKEKPLVPGYDGPIGSRVPGPSQDHDDIADFIFQVEKSKDVRIHSRPGSRDNTVNLTKYSNMRDPNTQLAEEMSSSSLMQTSATPPSRRLSNVPGLSTSSSPSRALTHAPHVRSRLSTHSIAEEITSRSGASGEGSDSPKIHEEEEEEDEEPFIFPQDNV